MKITLLAIIGLFTLAIGMSVAYAEIANFQYETDFLNQTGSRTNNVTNADGSVDVWIYPYFKYHYPNVTVALEHPEPVKGDPLGTFYQLILHDIARIFSPTINIEPVIEPQEEDEKEDEKIRRLTGPEQQALNRLKDVCPYEQGAGKTLAFQGVATIFLDHPMEWYALFEHKDERDLKSAECRGQKEVDKIANMTVGSRVINETDTFIFTPTDQTKKNDFDFSVNGTKWLEGADAATKARDSNIWTKGLYNGTDNKPFGFTPTVQRTVDAAQEAVEQHKIDTDNSIKNVKKLCSVLWISTGNGTTGLRTWDTNLTNGMCDNFLYISQWEFIEGGFAEKITKQVDLRGLINAKLAAGDEL